MPSRPRIGIAYHKNLRNTTTLEESPVLGFHAGSKKARRSVKKRLKRLNYTDEGWTRVPHEVNHNTEAKWKKKKACLLRFVDDGLICLKLTMKIAMGLRKWGAAPRKACGPGSKCLSPYSEEC